MKILQIKDIRSCEYNFMDYEFAQTHNFNLEDYETVWEDDVVDAELEDIFERFNIAQPSGYTGRSLTTSDIVELNGVKYYCDSIGWVKL